MFHRTYRNGITLSRLRRFLAAVLVACILLPAAARADTVYVAVASNFMAAAQDIAKGFERASGHEIKLSFGSTGQLYAQITQGAPFDVFLAADSARPAMAEAKGFAAVGSRFTYATGRIALYAPTMDDVGPELLKRADLGKLAIANQDTAPYGRAAVEAMQALGVYDDLAAKLVRGNNIAQAYQFVHTGSAEAGFVALSQLRANGNPPYWLVPEELYGVIAQDAVLLNHGAGNKAAKAFLAYLRSPEAARILTHYGYGTGD